MLPNFFFIALLLSSIFTAHSSYAQCVEQQKRLLLQLKDELIFSPSFSTKLVRWNEKEDECCNWYGVECDAAGNVVGLQLDDETISGGIGDSSSLFGLEYLEKLNLAYNRFNNTPIPRGIHNLTYLTHLNLSSADFGGQVPAEISSLTRLVSLDISYGYSPQLVNLEMLVQNLTGLRELYLDDVNITSSDDRRKWSHIISSYLPNLTSLSLWDCDLSGPLSNSFSQLHSLSTLWLDGNNLLTGALHLFSNFPRLTTLSLGGCNFKGSIPSTLANLTELIYVDLFYNLLTGPLSSTLFEGLSGLVYLDLGYNTFSGYIPNSLFQLRSLEILSLSGNLFHGTFQLSKLQSLPNLRTLDLSNNNLSVDVKNNRSSTYGLHKLEDLLLASCNLYDFPDFIEHSDAIRYLDLSHNHIAGKIPSWIWGTQLDYLDLSFNLLTKLEKPYHIPASLRMLYLQSNQLRGRLHFPLRPNTRNLTSNLLYLSLANNSFSGSIPTSICNAHELDHLDLSGNKFSGIIPPCLLENITVLDLGRNNISGHIPDNFSPNCNLYYFDLNNNTLEGKLPKSLEHCRSLKFMNVGNNNINDSFPCMLSSILRVLVLRSNRFHGEVRCHNSWEDLQVLDVSSNNFSGSLESTNFSGWRAMVRGSEAQLRHNDSGYYSLWSFGMTLTMKGIGMQFDKIWADFGTIDFSCNNFEGEIPAGICALSSLHHLNFSGNVLNGSIPKSFGQLSDLESLDLSRNQLTGRIPGELGGLTFLSFLNLSYNKLVGEIPNGRQLGTFSSDSFKGNPELCGLINLNISCSLTINDVSDLSPQEDENEREIEWEYVSAALGFVVGLGSIVWLLLFCRSFRDKYFDKIEEVAEEMLDRRSRRRRLARRVVRHRGRRQ